jgi:hypothetical protein
MLLAAGGLTAADLPVREIVLYKNGIGYFRRAGELKAGESARLEFQAEDMNDVLKSLTILDEAGAKVAGVRYDSSEPLERRLGQFPFALGERQPLTTLLDRLKGARVELRSGGETVAGAVVGARELTNPPREMLTLLLDPGELRTFEMAAVSLIRFSDPKLQAQLKGYLEVMANSRSKDSRSVYIDAPEAAARRFIATYVVPSPVWKSSYRLVFSESGEPLLEGWAIVDNTSGEDWNNVRLSLVSGRPVSFVSSLYEPRYVERETAELPEEEAAAPVLYDAVLDREVGVQKKAPPPPPPNPKAKTRQSMVANFTIGPQTANTVSVTPAAAAELGELFEYRFITPVTVRKSESAMLPFLQQKIGARKLLIYSESGSEHPRSAAELSNATGKTLDGGPITVYDGGAYAGEALIETLKAGDKRLISYAIDLGTRVTTALDSGRNVVREVHVRRGMLTTRSAVEETTTYTVRNVDAKPKTLVIEHPLRSSYKLVNMKASETTANAHRFELKLAANGVEKFPVIEERLVESSVALTSATPDFLVFYLQNKNLDAQARQALARIAEQKKLIAAGDAEIGLTEQRVNDAVRDEQRIRDNIGSLNRVSGQQDLVQKYAGQLAAQETRIATLRDRLAELRTNKAALESELAALIDKLEF